MQMHTKTIVLLSTALSMGLTASANANYKLGSYISQNGAELTPSFIIGASHDDNFYKTPNNEESRLIWKVAPSLSSLLVDGPDTYQFDIATVTSLHNKDSLDNHTDIILSTDIHKEFTSKHRLDVSAYADWLYEDRGTGLTEGLGDSVTELVKYRQQNINVDYEFGAQSSKAQLSLSAGYYNKQYANFENVSKYRDFDKVLLGITGYYNTQSTSRFFVEFKGENYRYDHIQFSGVSRDSDDIKLLVGMEWEASALTSGTFKLGYQNKDFKSSQRENFDGLSWQADLVWHPLTYSSVSFTTANAAKDPLVQGDYIEETLYGVTWEHQWNHFIGTFASLNYSKEQYSGGIKRKDTIKSSRLGLNYHTGNYGFLSTYIDYTDQTSTQNNLIYDSLIIGVDFTLGLKAN
ncbi:outer membrane beta-barrel protein [Pseudoalteromonas shioyasakiensis]|uniref:outer membrane beta-barrel protein n=1 Tax=Pseudoalteromonas shioyasakiensis TaxID=1190813 RepID=UPI002117FE9A|nr:outer membrane beta-barrel protein [Pseudoalteromonas shioyasakiensis]MCQ8876515.1 outer membrane beta-barrel protein [Pseudoalteromonas shioyasakiensis]